ncbi:hypothetical protein DHODJN_00610 [Methylorubrum extorquens]
MIWLGIAWLACGALFVEAAAPAPLIDQRDGI